MGVLVFKTTVADQLMVHALKPSLDGLAGEGQWNFDLEDCDKILRIKSGHVNPEAAIFLFNQFGLTCHELDD